MYQTIFTHFLYKLHRNFIWSHRPNLIMGTWFTEEPEDEPRLAVKTVSCYKTSTIRAEQRGRASLVKNRIYRFAVGWIHLVSTPDHTSLREKVVWWHSKLFLVLLTQQSERQVSQSDCRTAKYHVPIGRCGLGLRLGYIELVSSSVKLCFSMICLASYTGREATQVQIAHIVCTPELGRAWR